MDRQAQTPKAPMQSSSKRLRFAIVIFSLVATVLVGRLAQLQLIQGPSMAEKGRLARLTDRPVPAVRGAITDSHGNKLAVSVKSYDIVADQTLVVNPREVAATLAPVLRMDASDLLPKLVGTKRFVYIKRQVTPALWQKVKDLRCPGIFPTPGFERVYPAGQSAGNILGFTNIDGLGLAGIESHMNSVLAGTPGIARYEHAPSGDVIPGTAADNVPAIPGSTVRLTIDRDIQWYAETQLAAAVKQVKADYATIVMMDPRTGDIIAQATVPSVNPNEPGKTAASMRGNRAVTDVYEPGSTSKMMTMAAVLDYGAASPTTKFKVPFSMKFGTRTLRDHDRHGLKKWTLNGILAESSNIGTYLAATRIGKDKLYRVLKKFGVGESSGVDLPGETRGYVPPPKDWSITSFPTIAYGQGLSMNAFQAASAFATIANDGVRMQPRLIAGVTSADGAYSPTPVQPGIRVVKDSTARSLRTMMEAVVQSGTGTAAAIPGYRVAGKTGTASRYDPKLGRYNGYVSSFIGMVPAEAPELVVAVTFNNPRRSHYGGVIAAPVFAKVAKFAIQSRQIAPSRAKPAKIPLTW